MELKARQQMLQGKADIMEDSSISTLLQPPAGECGRMPATASATCKQRGDARLALRATLKLQFNPARIVSTGAKIDKKTLGERPCFLCEQNRPKEQMTKQIDEHFHLLVNPFPILPVHFTIPATQASAAGHRTELRRDAPIADRSTQRTDGILQRSEVWCLGSRPPALPGWYKRHAALADQLAAPSRAT